MLEVPYKLRFIRAETVNGESQFITVPEEDHLAQIERIAQNKHIKTIECSKTPFPEPR